ncbi:NOP8 60S ribosome subunit biogenesis protein NOP8 [Candida maltosa Xu316]
MSEEPKELRIHIGNVSPKLKESSSSLTSRIEKYGKIITPIEFHTKPSQSHYFGYITLSTTNQEYEKLKKSLNGVQFMGMKLSVSLAKPTYLEKLQIHNNRTYQTKHEEQLRRDKIVKSRLEKIKEYKTVYPVNNITSQIVTSSNPSTYSVSEHTYKNISGNVKNNPPPNSRLDGRKSYGEWTNPKKIHDQFLLRSGKGAVIRGAHRKSSRSVLGLKQQTLRILINGELKTLKNYKTKLWGVEKNKTVRDLTWKYVDGEWRSGDDHVIERCGISGHQAQNYGKNLGTHDNIEEVVDQETSQDGHGEADKNKSVLAKMFASFDFDKPMEVDDEKEEVEIDSKGRKKAKHYDFEIEGKVSDNEDDGSDNLDEINIDDADQIIQSYTKSINKPIKEQYYDEDDEGNEIEMDEFATKLTTEAIKDKYEEEHKEDESEEEEEFMPTFGAPQTSEPNNTEALRSLFNPASTTELKLGLDENDEDLDEDKQIDTKQQEELFSSIQKQREDEIILQRQQKFGLFWPHFESPFLATQSQLSKLGVDKMKLPGEEEQNEENGEDESLYEKWFWSMRGEISRECKRRRRDVLRSLRKKNVAK